VSRPRTYHTKSTVPAGVRGEVVAGWDALWRRLRRLPERDRALEFKAGTRMQVGGTEYVLRYSYGRAAEGAPPEKWGFYVRLRAWPPAERHVSGSSACGFGKPYTYFDELQDALDSLLVSEVMDS
jgi:hypothetical protein